MGDKAFIREFVLNLTQSVTFLPNRLPKESMNFQGRDGLPKPIMEESWKNLYWHKVFKKEAKEKQFWCVPHIACSPPYTAELNEQSDFQFPPSQSYELPEMQVPTYLLKKASPKSAKRQSLG